MIVTKGFPVRSLLFASASIIIISANSSARAQVAQPPAPDSSAIAQSGEIVVTAEKRTERLRDVPVSITAVTGKALNEIPLAGVGEALTAVPGVAVNQAITGRGGLKNLDSVISGFSA